VGWAFWIRTVDVGILILSMHSARELCGRADPGYLAAFLTPAAQRT
jgi:aspartyl aminopeptidase